MIHSCLCLLCFGLMVAHLGCLLVFELFVFSLQLMDSLIQGIDGVQRIVRSIGLIFPREKRLKYLIRGLNPAHQNR